MAPVTLYYLTHPEIHTADGGNPICTVATDDGQQAVVLFTDESSAEEFRDAWVEEEGWQVGFMQPAALVRWLRALPESGVPLALVDPGWEGPDDLSGEVFDAALLADELAEDARDSRQNSRPSKRPSGPRSQKPRGGDP